MRTARMLMPLGILALAATALVAPSAVAEHEPMVHHQAPQIIVQQEAHGAADANCPLVTPSPAPTPSPSLTAGGCRLHVSGVDIGWHGHLTAGGTEFLAATCNFESDLRIDAAGEGYFAHQEFTQGALGTCAHRPCGQVTPPTGEGRAHSFYLRELEPAPTESLQIHMCTENLDGTGAHHCTYVLQMTEPTPHAYRLIAADVSALGTSFPHCELGSAATPAVLDTEAVPQTTGEAQAEQRVEIRHQ
jgi:hypothetical protein